MIDKTFVKACRGPEDEPIGTQPLSWLYSAIHSLGNLEQAIADRDEDPDAYRMTLIKLQGLHDNLQAALSAHDQAAARRERALEEIDSLYGKTSNGWDLMLAVVEHNGWRNCLNDEAIEDVRKANIEHDWAGVDPELRTRFEALPPG
jgi:hypothetical protein